MTHSSTIFTAFDMHRDTVLNLTTSKVYLRKQTVLGLEFAPQREVLGNYS